MLLVLSLAIAIGVPAAAFADDIGSLLGFSNRGTAVAARTLSNDSSLVQDMRQLGFPSTLELLGTREGIRFYAAQKSLGYCLAVVEAATPLGSQRAASDVGCANGGDAFPSARNPVFVVPVGHRFAGFAADGVKSVALVDGSGRTLASANVSQNLFVGGAMPMGPVTVVALDAHGDVLARFESRRAASAASPRQAAERRQADDGRVGTTMPETGRLLDATSPQGHRHAMARRRERARAEDDRGISPEERAARVRGGFAMVREAVAQVRPASAFLWRADSRRGSWRSNGQFRQGPARESEHTGRFLEPHPLGSFS